MAMNQGTELFIAALREFLGNQEGITKDSTELLVFCCDKPSRFHSLGFETRRQFKSLLTLFRDTAPEYHGSWYGMIQYRIKELR